MHLRIYGWGRKGQGEWPRLSSCSHEPDLADRLGRRFRELSFERPLGTYLPLRRALATAPVLIARGAVICSYRPSRCSALSRSDLKDSFR